MRSDSRPDQAEAREKVLRERAARLARPTAAPAGSGVTELLLIVRVGSERRAIPVSAVAEIVRSARCARIPLAPAAVAGVVQVRGEIRPLFHLTGAAGPTDNGATEGLAVLLARTGRRQAGLLVDGVEDIRPAAEADRRPAPAGMPHVLWLTADLIPVLDPERIFPEEMA